MSFTEKIALNLTGSNLKEVLKAVFGDADVPHIMDISNYISSDDRTIGKLDPTAKSIVVLGGQSFENDTIPYKEGPYGHIRMWPQGSNVQSFKYNGAKFVKIELRSNIAYDLCRNYIFYTDLEALKLLLKEIRRLCRADKTIRVYGGQDVPLSKIKKLPYLPPSKLLSEWMQYIHPQLVRKETYNHVLLHGPPGCGKTAFCRWMATKYPKWKFMFVQPQSISKVGDITDVYDKARAYSPSVVVFEDIDLIGKARDTTSCNFTHALGELLNCIDGVDPESKILTIASTNNPAALDPAVIRAGRLGIPLTTSYTTDEKIRMLRLYYKFPKLTDEDLREGIAGRTSIPVDLKMTAKVYQIYEEYEHRKCGVGTLKAIAKMIASQDKNKYVPIFTNNGDEDVATPTIGAKPEIAQSDWED